VRTKNYRAFWKDTGKLVKDFMDSEGGYGVGIINDEDMHIDEYIGLRDNHSDKINHEMCENDIVEVEIDGEKTIHRIMYMAAISQYPAFDLYPGFECDSNCISHCLCEPGWSIKIIGRYQDDPGKWDKLMRENENNKI
jgi:hypothetical protein